MVHPDDDVAPRLSRGAYGDGLPGAIEHHERACGVKADAADRSGCKLRARHRGANRADASAPDVGGGLLHDIARLAPKRDRVARRRKQRAFRIEDAGARARRADIDADESLPHGRIRADCAAGCQLAGAADLTSRYSLRRRGRRCPSSGSPRPRRGRVRPTRSPRPRRDGPSACRRSRPRTWRGWI